jgi:hypothetical protein
MTECTIARTVGKIQSLGNVIPANMRASRRAPRTYRRVAGATTIGRKQYEVVVDLQLGDGTILAGYPLDRAAPSTRFQARKLLKRYRRDIPEAYCVFSQSFV